MCTDISSMKFLPKDFRAAVRWLRVTGVVSLCFVSRPNAAAAAPDFARDIQPILERSCLSCHGPEKQKSGYRLDVKPAPVTDPETGLTFGYLRYTETQSNRIFVTVECLYGYKQALTDGIKRNVKP